MIKFTRYTCLTTPAIAAHMISTPKQSPETAAQPQKTLPSPLLLSKSESSGKVINATTTPPSTSPNLKQILRDAVGSTAYTPPYS